MRKSFVKLLLIAVCGATLTVPVHGTGGFAPDRWLENGGIASEMSPEFYWELELKRMARDFVPKEKRVEVPQPEGNPEDPHAARTTATINFMDKADTADFDDAIKTGRIKPPDPAKAREAHEGARKLVNTLTIARAAITGEPRPPEDAKKLADALRGENASVLEGEFASEFADYHRGAYAFRRGSDHYDEARQAWEGLLKRPEAERHYRSVWAAFMLGKLALAAKDPVAVQWFRQARELASQGFADSLGLAADSYGWEAKSELLQGHFEAAAKLYLTQLALGDQSAIVSLKAVIPDRADVEGTLNLGGGEPERLEEYARDPLLRRLETAHVLATETQEEVWMSGDYARGETPSGSARCTQWLDTLEKAGLKKVEDADHLGWVAYTAGRYPEAARWLAMAKPDSPTALWLKAKLERRAGKYAQAVASMSAALKVMEADVVTFGDTDFSYGERGYGPGQSAAGDLAGLHLTRGEFVDAMDAFLQGDLWGDAAFIADRVLTIDELKKYVDANFPKAAIPPPERDDTSLTDNPTRMRWMLARRLVRAQRFDEAMPYFLPKERAILQRYVTALKKGEDSKLPKPQRARALFTAAWIARHNGMEIMGTEVEPDGFDTQGSFPPGHLDTERAEGVRVNPDIDDRGEQIARKKPAKFAIPATANEKRRLAANSPHPARRYHYRWVAAELAWQAAALMSDNTEELADVLNTGGGWIKDRDDKGADKFIQAMERRCQRTEIGKDELAKHWFVDQSGPWSDAMEKEDAANSPATGNPQ
jgi:hypothetical protein